MKLWEILELQTCIFVIFQLLQSMRKLSLCWNRWLFEDNSLEEREETTNVTTEWGLMVEAYRYEHRQKKLVDEIFP